MRNNDNNYSHEIQLNKKQKRKTQLLKSPSAHAYTEFRSLGDVSQTEIMHRIIKNMCTQTRFRLL